MWIPALLLFISLCGPAWAGPTTRVVDGAVLGTMLVNASKVDVERALRDSEVSGSLSPDVLSAKVEPAGTCQRITRETRGLVRSLKMVVLRCPTGSGWRESLVHSDDFSRYDVEWSLTEGDDGTTVEYRVSLDVNLPVPAALVSKNVQRAAMTTLQALQQALDRHPSP